MSDTQLLALAEIEISAQHKQIINLRGDLNIAMKALTKISNQDYRGNRGSEVFIARDALKKINK